MQDDCINAFLGLDKPKNISSLDARVITSYGLKPNKKKGSARFKKNTTKLSRPDTMNDVEDASIGFHS